MRFLYAALLLAVSCCSALAQREPEIVIPGKPGVPVYINGIDASWGIVEGEFGLDRPNQINPTVVYRPFLAELPYGVPSYFPADGRAPGYGRLEIVPPNRRAPAPGPRFHRSWSSQSDPGPVTDYPPIPPMIVAPTVNYGPGNNGPGNLGPSNLGPGNFGPGSNRRGPFGGHAGENFPNQNYPGGNHPSGNLPSGNHAGGNDRGGSNNGPQL
jgi:hypothetical protein